jgi:F0F1-type ATP synthase membrane subunit c/vacuolar-type H+-ATPase subunit K
MGTLTRRGGLIASIILIAFGIGAVYMGIDGRSYVRDSLAQEKIVGTPDSSIAGQKVDTGSEAKAFAEVMREHTLEATGGKTYAEMDRFLAAKGGTTNDETAAKVENGKPVDNPARNIWVNETALSNALNMSYFAEQVALFGLVMGIALLLTGIGFGIVSVRLLRKDREEADMRVPAAGAVPAAS